MLTPKELEDAKRAFLIYDRDASGEIDVSELRASLEALGLSPTDEELSAIMAKLDVDGSGGIEFSEFLRILERQKAAQQARGDDADTVEAFVAMGGKADKSGCVSVEKLQRTIQDFELTIDLDRMLEEMDKDASGTVDYREFALLLSSAC